MKNSSTFNQIETRRPYRNNVLAIYIATITLVVVTYSLVTAVTVL
ncbi:MAG: hypothetical protein R3359_02185 [Marinirhabdus sp.]|nr:hypothetical protein [Marinirhabdus sp.]